MSSRKRYTAEQKAAALDLVAEHGTAEAARRTGINAGTIGSWATRAGIAGPDAAVMAAPTAASAARKLATTAERKAKLAEDLLGDLERLRERLFEPITERVVRTVSHGHNAGSSTEIVDVELSMPKPTDQRALVTAIQSGVNAVQLLTGEATERIEQLGASVERTPENEAQIASVLELVQDVA